jgi:transposase-like protein
MGRFLGAMAKVTRPRCEVCKSSYNVHAVNRPGQLEGAHGALRWLCGSCEYTETRSDAARVAQAHRPKVPQVETLW